MAEESVGAAIAFRLILKDIGKSLKRTKNRHARRALKKMKQRLERRLAHADKDRFQEMLTTK